MISERLCNNFFDFVAGEHFLCEYFTCAYPSRCIGPCLCTCNHRCMRVLSLMVKWIYVISSLTITSDYVMKNVIKDTFQAEAALGHGPVNSYISFAIHSSNP